MRIPDSVVTSYDEALSVAAPLAKVSGTRLRVMCQRNNWLFDERLKPIESCLSKLEAGSQSLDQLHDLYATTVVVPTQSELKGACEAVLEVFSGEIKQKPAHEAEHFAYDDIHIIARLDGKISPRAVPSEEVLKRPFEIQIRTGMQYAWWRATHDHVYKSSDPDSRNWKARRAVGQTRAALELLDGLLSDLPAAAALQREARGIEVDEMLPANLLKLWPLGARPKDVYRFCSVVNRYLSASGMSLEELGIALRSPDFRAVIASRSVTPLQGVALAIRRHRGADFDNELSAANMKVLVTPEALSAVPEMADFHKSVVTVP